MGSRKRRTARGITCPSVTCPGGGGYPSPSQGVPRPDLAGGYPILTWPGDPILSWPGGYQILTWPGGGTPGWVSPHLELGYPHLGLVTVIPSERTWDQWKYYGMEMGVPHPKIGHQTSGSIMGLLWVRGR